MSKFAQISIATVMGLLFTLSLFTGGASAQTTTAASAAQKNWAQTGERAGNAKNVGGQEEGGSSSEPKRRGG